MWMAQPDTQAAVQLRSLTNKRPESIQHHVRLHEARVQCHGCDIRVPERDVLDLLQRCQLGDRVTRHRGEHLPRGARSEVDYGCGGICGRQSSQEAACHEVWTLRVDLEAAPPRLRVDVG